MREMGLVLALLTISTPAAAQWSAVEFGVDIGRACIGDSSGFCGDESGTMRAAHASAWIDDRLEIGVRLAVLPLEDWNYSQERDSRFDLVNDPAARTLSHIDVAVRGPQSSHSQCGSDLLFRARPPRPWLSRRRIWPTEQSRSANLRPRGVRAPHAYPFVADWPHASALSNMTTHRRFIGTNHQPPVRPRRCTPA